MTLEIALAFILLAGVIVAFLREWGSPDVVALGGFGVALALGLVDRENALDVFGNPAAITIACMFIIGAALEQSGCIRRLAKWFLRAAGGGELRALAVLILVVAALSAFVNTTPVVVVFLPVVIALGAQTGINSSRLLIPLSYAAILGGTCTLIGTSTNILVDGIAQRDGGLAPFSMFEMSKLGLVYAAVGFIYMLTVGRKLLPDRVGAEAPQEEGMEAGSQVFTQFGVGEKSSLAGKPLTATLLSNYPGLRILEVRRLGHVLLVPLNTLEVRAGDRLLLATASGERFQAEPEMELEELETRELKLVEGVVGNGSEFVGRTLRDINFRQRHGVLVSEVHRRGRVLKAGIEELPLRFGDSILAEGPAQAVASLARQRHFIALNAAPVAPAERQSKRAPIVLAVLGVFVTLAGFQVVPVPVLAVLAVMALLASGSILPSSAYRSVNWGVVAVVIGMLGIADALRHTGAIDWGVGQMIGVLGDVPPWVVLAAIYLAATVATELISNHAVAALLTPVAITLAQSPDINVDPRPFVVAVMLGCAASFATPVGYQTNTYVYGAGGYRFRDFTKVGAPLNLILWPIATALIPIFWPF